MEYIRRFLIRLIRRIDRIQAKSRQKQKKRKRYRWKYKRQFFVFLLFVLVLILALLIIGRAAGGDDKSIKGHFDQVKKILQDEVNAEKKKTRESAYSGFYYYDKSRLSRYIAYSKKNPKLKAGDVVWMVNVNLDKPAYRNIEISPDKNSQFVLVTKRYTVGKNYIPDDLIAVSDGISVKKCAAEPFKMMRQAAIQDGYYIEAHSGYRSYAFQKSLYLSYIEDYGKDADTFSARPGFSEHQTGLAIDLVKQGSDKITDFSNTAEAEWVKKNAWKYGFIIRYTDENRKITGFSSEPWHIRYIGKKHAYRMKKLGISTYEEYKVKYIDYSKSESERKTINDKYVAQQRE